MLHYELQSFGPVLRPSVHVLRTEVRGDTVKFLSRLRPFARHAKALVLGSASPRRSGSTSALRHVRRRQSVSKWGRRLRATKRRLPMESRNQSAEHQLDVVPDSGGISRRRLLPMIGAAGLAGMAPRAFSRDDRFGRPGNAVARYVYVGTYTA